MKDKIFEHIVNKGKLTDIMREAFPEFSDDFYNNLLYCVCSLGHITPEQASAVFNSCGPIAKAAHIMPREIAAMMAFASRFGMKDDDVSRTIIKTVSDLIFPSTGAIRKLEQNGLSRMKIERSIKNYGILQTIYSLQSLVEPSDYKSIFTENIFFNLSKRDKK